MKRRINIATIVFFAATLHCAQAWATNGYFLHGYGIKAQGQAGVSIAQPQDALASANNPAGIAWVGNRIDVGATVFSPDRHAQIEGNGANANGIYDGNARQYFLLPEFGYSKQLSDRLGVGFAVYGNGGMNTDYRNNPFSAFGSSGRAGVDLTQVFLTPTLSYRFTERQSFGIALNFVYQRFAAKGLSAFANSMFSSDSENMTNRGHDISTGIGLRLGWQGEVFDGLTLGLAWSSKIATSEFDRYAGLFAEHGSFDVPENYAIGLSYQATPKLTLGADVQEIKYSDVASVGNVFDLQSLYAGNAFGSSTGAGFGWRDITIYKFAISYAIKPHLTVRGGYSHSEQPIPEDQTFLGILAPGIIQDHVSIGLTWTLAQNNEFSLSYTRGLKEEVNGNGSIPADFGGGEANLGMDQHILGLAYAWNF